MFEAVMFDTELRLRFRRNSTWVVLLAVMLVLWFTVLDPSSGYAMLAANTSRVAYNSTGLALGSSVIATTLLGLFGFYLVRGRVAEDLHAGLGHVIGATPTHNAGLVLVRWAGGVVYLGSLIIALRLTMFVLQAVLDPTGMGVLTQRGQMLLHTQSLAVGLNEFDKPLAPEVLGSGFWTWPMIFTRLGAMVMAALPLAIAVNVFHRFLPDRVAASRTRKRRAIGAGINRLLRPFDIISAEPGRALAAAGAIGGLTGLALDASWCERLDSA